MIILENRCGTRQLCFWHFSLECNGIVICQVSWNFRHGKFLTGHQKSEKRWIWDMYSVQLLLCRYTLWCQSNVIRKIALRFNPSWYALSRPTIYCITVCNLKILFLYNMSKYCFKFFETCPVKPRYKRRRVIRDIWTKTVWLVFLCLPC